MSGMENRVAPGLSGLSDVGTRQINESDALGFLDAVELHFKDQPEVYNSFVGHLKDFKSQIIDTPTVIERVAVLLNGNPILIEGFNAFLPAGYRIELDDTHEPINSQSPSLPGGRNDATLLYSVNTHQADNRNGEPHPTYKQFLEILQENEKKQRDVADQSHVHARVQIDLTEEFKNLNYLPDVAASPE